MFNSTPAAEQSGTSGDPTLAPVSEAFRLAMISQPEQMAS